ncbi:hypothetical protein Taro_021550 [Colocasia esculenta]|uniref:CCHC-type domain-containing protein n=1 Tax=Colocasia esculenta TaxID=4460 RepID=A0A843V5P0_COLES|nr:hypothetical protein [Colocasia esculenta]
MRAGRPGGSRVVVSLRVEGRPSEIQGAVIPLRVEKRRPAAAGIPFTPPLGLLAGQQVVSEPVSSTKKKIQRSEEKDQMAAQGHSKGQSVNRPLLFNGEDYTYWKTRMEYFLQGLDYQIWSIVEEGDLLVTNERDKWTEDDKKRISLNCKGKSILCCALSKKEFNRISACKSTMEMWEKQRITYEGTDKVKETRIDILVTQYERFQMQPGESITQIFSRFIDIMNGLASLGKTNEMGDMGKDFKRSEAKDGKKTEPICYECKKPGHIKAECPKLKKSEYRKKESSRKPRKFKKKAMAAAWDNSSDSDNESSSSNEEKEEANLAFMANIEDKRRGYGAEFLTAVQQERFTSMKAKLCGNKAVDIADL